MDVIEIVTDYLTKNKFDGLFLAGECACELGDLSPCCGITANCEAGYYINVDECNCHSYHIGSKNSNGCSCE